MIKEMVCVISGTLLSELRSRSFGEHSHAGALFVR